MSEAIFDPVETGFLRRQAPGSGWGTRREASAKSNFREAGFWGLCFVEAAASKRSCRLTPKSDWHGRTSRVASL